jgi:hypothetical protein
MRTVLGRQSQSVRSLGAALAAIVGLIAATGPQAFADVRIVSSPGGEIEKHLQYFERIKRSDERVIIDGPCLSACTLVLSTLPRNRICMTSRAVLGFHAPFLMDDNGRTFRTRKLTHAMAASYPAAVRSWLKRKGGLTPQLKYLKGRELTSMYPRC